MLSFEADIASLPILFPTQYCEPEFWEWLGRTVATFGFLEDALGKAIFALTATQEFPPDEIKAAYAQWSTTLEKALTDPLGHLINSYEKALRQHPKMEKSQIANLTKELRAASKIRNVLCHGSWGKPDGHGRSLPRFFDRGLGAFETPVGLAFLKQTQRAAAELACHVVSSVTLLGLQFPGSNGSGEVVWPPQK